MTNNNPIQGIPHCPPKCYGINKISVVTKVLLKPLIDRYGAAYVQILLDWPDIVGSYFAELSSIINLKFPLGKKMGGTLHLRCMSAAIPLLQAQSPQIIDRINRYFGYNAVAQIRFQAGLIVKKKRVHGAQLRLLPDEMQTKIQSITNKVSDDNLREALQRLGTGIYLEEVNYAAKET